MIVQNLEDALYGNSLLRENVKITNRVKRSERRKPRMNRPGKSGKEIGKQFHPVFVSREQRLGLFTASKQREMFVVGRFHEDNQHIELPWWFARTGCACKAEISQ